MEKTNQAFRLIVVRKPYQPRLFSEEEIDLKERYKVIATNLDWPKDAVVKWKSLLFSFNFHSFSCQKYPFPKINRGFWAKQWKNLRKNIIFIRLDHILYGVLIVEILKLKIF